MNLKYIGCFLILSLFYFPLRGQQQVPELEWGKQVRNTTNAQITTIVTQDASGFYAVKTKRGNQPTVDGPQKVWIEHYNNKMNLTKSKEIDLKWKNKKRQYENILKIGGELYLFTSFNNQAKKKNFLFAQKMSKIRLQPEKKLTYIAEIDTKNKYREGSFHFHICRDSSKLLIYNQLPDQKNKPERFTIRVFDKQLNPLWDKNITLPYDDDLFTVEDYRIDNNGNVYFLGILYGGLAQKRGMPNYQYIVLAYTKDGGEVNKYNVKLKDKFITDMTFRIADDGHLVCSGFYSEKGTYSIKGTYFFRVDPFTKEIYNENLKELDFEFRAEYVSDRKKERMAKAEKRGDHRKSAELYQFALDDLVLRNDGGALLVAEQFYIEEWQDYDYFYNSTRITYIYHYNDIIIVNINPDGEIEWASRIPKWQETRNDGGWYSSYAMSIVRDKIYFVYNDNAKNFDPNRRDNRRRYNFNGRHSAITISEVGQDGSVQTTPLFQNNDANVLTRPKICKQIGRKKMAVYGENGRTYRFGLLTF